MNVGHSMLLLLLFSPLAAHPLVQATPRTATRQLLTTVDTSSAQPTTISGARLPALWPHASPRTSLASPSPILTHASPSPSPSLTGGEDPQPCESCEDVECTFEHLVEDYMEDPNDTYDREYGVCTTVAGSGQTKTFYFTEPGMPHKDRTLE